MKCGQYFKIGIAEDVKKRLNQIRSHNPYPIEIVLECETKNASRLEARIHRAFKHKHHYREWFRLGKNDLKNLTVALIRGDMERGIPRDIV